jgi:hypothetical protein
MTQNAPPQPLTFGPCQKCKQPMRLERIEPDVPDHETRFYECTACGYSDARKVKYL